MNPALKIEALYKTYPNGINALKGIDLEVKQGDFFALLGANGAGKSTTIGIVSHLLTKSSGSVFINGYALDQKPDQAKASLGLVPQEVNLNIFETCEQVLINQAGYYGVGRKQARQHCDRLLDQLGLAEKQQTIVRHLSGGMKRRLMIARALIHRPQVLILDEPTAGVDIEIRRSMWDFLKKTNEAGTTIILTTHYLEEAEHLCKNIAIIDQGKIIENTSMKALLKTIQHQTFVFDTIDPIISLPNMAPFSIIQIDDHRFEIRIDNTFNLNEVFQKFDQHKLKIHSMRNKTNRLEELFLDLINHEP